MRIFISSVQKEFAQERKRLAEYLSTDTLLKRFCYVFLFEQMPAKSREASELYLEEVRQCDIYLGLFGSEYGFEFENGKSPTQLEFELACDLNKHRLIFVRGGADVTRNPKMELLIQSASQQVVRRRFEDVSDLIVSVYASLVDYLSDRGLLRFTPFDASICDDVSLSDLSESKLTWFVKRARQSRGFPLDEVASQEQVLTQLRLMNKHGITNAAVLLFAPNPQQFIFSSEIKCAHFHGTQVQKPIPFYQVYKGNLFELIDQGVNFVLSKINLSVGTRSKGPEAPVSYEIPPEVISEAIVNAIAHRDYTSVASVQIMLFSDRLEIWNPGRLPSGLNLTSIEQPHGSYPQNPLISEPLYLTQYIERMGTGILDMVNRCLSYGLTKPIFSLDDGFKITLFRNPPEVTDQVTDQTEQVTEQATAQTEQVTDQITAQTDQVTEQVTAQTEQVTEQVKKLLIALVNEPLNIKELLNVLNLKHRPHFIQDYLTPAIHLGLVEYTQPNSPKSPTQKYKLTAKGKKGNHV